MQARTPNARELGNVFAHVYQCANMDEATLRAVAERMADLMAECERDSFIESATMSGLPIYPARVFDADDTPSPAPLDTSMMACVIRDRKASLPIRVEADGTRCYGRRMVRNTRGRYCLARLEFMPNGYWRADYVGSGLVDLFDSEPSHVAA